MDDRIRINRKKPSSFVLAHCDHCNADQSTARHEWTPQESPRCRSCGSVLARSENAKDDRNPEKPRPCNLCGAILRRGNKMKICSPCAERNS